MSTNPTGLRARLAEAVRRRVAPPLPVPITSDEYEVPAPSRWPGSWTKVQRALAWLGAAVIAGGVVFLMGYAVGRHSVAPRPGEEARLDSAVARLAHTADSLRNVAAWEYAQRMILEQKQAAAPVVDVIRPGVVQITPKDPSITPRVVEIPVEVTAALSLERQINASLRVELDATRAIAAAQEARADSLARAVVLARASRPSRLGKITRYGGLLIVGILIGRGTR